jgi:hypothetical protein
MTIGIGVLADSAEGRRKNIVPDTLILIADTMGSFGSVDSHGRLHKTCMKPEQGVYCVIANQVDKGAELFEVICSCIGEVPKPERTYGRILTALAEGCLSYKRHKFQICEMPKMRLPPEWIDPRTVPAELQRSVQERWEAFDIGCDLIIGVFDDKGCAWLFQLSGAEHEIANVTFPGFSAIGSGADNARFWLSRRQHTLGLLPLRAAYHAYEAKLMAEGSPHVNEHLDIVVATNEAHWFCTTHKSVNNMKVHPEINIQSLKKLFKKYGMRNTDRLGRPLTE